MHKKKVFTIRRHPATTGLRRPKFKPRKFCIKRGLDGQFHIYAN